MDLDRYLLVTDNKHEIYEFFSEGPKGTIKKVVQYQRLQIRIYDLALGDWDEEGRAIKDYTKTNNADRKKVLATVASTVLDFSRWVSTVLAYSTSGLRTEYYFLRY